MRSSAPTASPARPLRSRAGYYGNKTFSVGIDTGAALRHLTAAIEVPSAELKPIKAATTVAALKAALEAVAEPSAAVTALLARIAGWRKESLSHHLIDTYWSEWLPVFFYFDDYSTMRGRVSLPHIKAREEARTLEESEKTFLSLLATVDADLADFETANFERLTRELEGAANGITDKVFEYWTQNKELRLEIRVSSVDPTTSLRLTKAIANAARLPPPPSQRPFDERSRGFVWFFSFFAYFSDVEQQDGRRTVLLLDEPGLALHATAQSDFLRFIDGELAQTHQVLYSTHSPFLVNPGPLDCAAPSRTSTAGAPRSARTFSAPTARRSSRSRPHSATNSPKLSSSGRTAFSSKVRLTCSTSRS
ncbi:MAG: ATP-binding protein [Austwickia sp.]|nr:ATP-binding protein [Austwickia sp.]